MSDSQKQKLRDKWLKTILIKWSIINPRLEAVNQGFLKAEALEKLVELSELC